MLENNIPGYLVMMAVSALLCGAVAALSARKEASFPAGRAVGFGAAFVALGAVLGLVTGLMFCAVVVWLLRFLGKLIGSGTLASTRIGGWLLQQGFLTRYLGI